MNDNTSIDPSDTAPITYPERPTCHDGDWQAKQFAPQTWRPAGKRLHPDNDHVPAYRSCSYCGSMHPEDLLNALRAGATLELADMKYGWPHKFYVNGIPNPNVGNPVSRSSGSGPLPLTDDERARWQRMGDKPGCRVEFTEGEGRWQAKVFEPDGATTWGKFYTVHLMDLPLPAFNEVAAALEEKGPVRFWRDGDKTAYGPARRANPPSAA